MENIIKEVLSIDQKASNIMKNTQDLLEIREKDVKEKIESIRMEIMNKTKIEAKELYDSIIKEAECEAEGIRNNSIQECENLESKYIKLKDKLENIIFSRIFSWRIGE